MNSQNKHTQRYTYLNFNSVKLYFTYRAAPSCGRQSLSHFYSSHSNKPFLFLLSPPTVPLFLLSLQSCTDDAQSSVWPPNDLWPLSSWLTSVLTPALQHSLRCNLSIYLAFLHCQAGSVVAWHARQFHRLISSCLCKTEGVKSPVFTKSASLVHGRRRGCHYSLE